MLEKWKHAVDNKKVFGALLTDLCIRMYMSWPGNPKINCLWPITSSFEATA